MSVLFILQFNPTKLTLESGVTRPPPLLSEADLLSYMDREEVESDRLNNIFKNLIFFCVKVKLCAVKY